MRLLPDIAFTGRWYVVALIRALFGAAFLLVLFWPYLLMPDVRTHMLSGTNAIVTGPAVFLVQRRQIEERAGRSLARCREVIRCVRRGEPVEDPAELAAVIAAIRPQLRSGGVRWVLSGIMLGVAALVFGLHARHLTPVLLGDTGWVVAGAVAVFALTTRRERQDRELAVLLDAASA